MKTLRTKLIDAIESQYDRFSPTKRTIILGESLSRLGDMDLIVLAQECGINTDELYAEEVE